MVAHTRPSAPGAAGRPRRGVVVGVALACLALVAGCSAGGGAPTPSAAPPAEPAAPAPAAPAPPPGRTLTVVASTNVWGDIASQLAGPGVEVRSIINDPNTDPHSYEGTPADAAAFSSADLIVYNGGGYDEFVDQVLEADPAAQGKAIEAFALRPDQAEENEHVWFDPATVTAVVGQVAQRLGQADPAQAEQINQRAMAFAGQVQQLAQQTAAIGQARPGLRAASTEPVPFYLEATAGIEDATPEEFLEAIEEETDPPVAAVAETSQLVGSRGVNVLLYNPQTETPVTQSIRQAAEGAGVPVVNITETIPPGLDYLGWVNGYRTAIATAVGAPQ